MNQKRKISETPKPIRELLRKLTKKYCKEDWPVYGMFIYGGFMLVLTLYVTYYEMMV